jgi:hypothetical protein
MEGDGVARRGRGRSELGFCQRVKPESLVEIVDNVIYSLHISSLVLCVPRSPSIPISYKLYNIKLYRRKCNLKFILIFFVMYTSYFVGQIDNLRLRVRLTNTHGGSRIYMKIIHDAERFITINMRPMHWFLMCYHSCGELYFSLN